MSCTNCYNGCTETVSDQCVKYTGNNIPALGIQHGDTLLSVENAITNFILTAMDGSGIVPSIDNSIICNIIKQYLSDCAVLDLNSILTAIIKAVCDIQQEVDIINVALTELNADYTIDCLEGVTTSSDTHDIVQAVITKLCTLDANFAQLLIDLPFTYVSIANINTYIADYLNNDPTASLMSSKMVPYTIVPFYPTSGFLAGKFDGTGAGLGDWYKIYLCNGQNGTPDLRGSVIVGSNAMGSNVYANPNVDPALGNPSYAIGSISGVNTITLTPPQIPAHIHTASATVNQTPHGHTLPSVVTAGGPYGLRYGTDFSHDILGNSGISDANISVSITVDPNTPAGNPHDNVQPVVGAYFIMYIP